MTADLAFLAVDLQGDFTRENGAHYRLRPSVSFVRASLVPWLRASGRRAAEIVSDYRQPRLGGRGNFCVPGTAGFASELPADVKHPKAWVKSGNSPLWIRENTGDRSEVPTLPVQVPPAFDRWLLEVVGSINRVEIVLFGLTLDRCVLLTAQELAARGYTVHILEEGVDTYSGTANDKTAILDGAVLGNWARPLRWAALRERSPVGLLR